MMKKMLILGLLTATLFGFGQINKNQTLKTVKYAGVYKFGDNGKKGVFGSVTVYPETDSTILFFIDICRGAPSYNLGQLYDRLKIENGKGLYYSKNSNAKIECKWQVTINKKVLTIATLDNCYQCGFGNGVVADYRYQRKDNSIPHYFTDGHGHRIYFSNTSPENYRK
jgi:hypothetical protein